MAEERDWLMSADIYEHGLQLRAAQVAGSGAEVALRSAKSQPQVVCASE